MRLETHPSPLGLLLFLPLGAGLVLTPPPPALLPHYCPLPVADPVRSTITSQYRIGNPATSPFPKYCLIHRVPKCKGTTPILTLALPSHFRFAHLIF